MKKFRSSIKYNKVILPIHCKFPLACIDFKITDNFRNAAYTHHDVNMLFFLVGIINSQTGRYIFFLMHATVNKIPSWFHLVNVAELRLPIITKENQHLKQRVIELAKIIYYRLEKDENANYAKEQAELDEIVFKLYKLDELPLEVQEKIKNHKF